MRERFCIKPPLASTALIDRVIYTSLPSPLILPIYRTSNASNAAPESFQQSLLYLPLTSMLNNFAHKLAVLDERPNLLR
jgi:hypothetical protein